MWGLIDELSSSARSCDRNLDEVATSVILAVLQQDGPFRQENEPEAYRPASLEHIVEE